MSLLLLQLVHQQKVDGCMVIIGVFNDGLKRKRITILNTVVKQCVYLKNQYELYINGLLLLIMYSSPNKID